MAASNLNVRSYPKADIGVASLANDGPWFGNKKPQATGTSAACVGGKLWRPRDSCLTGGELEDNLDFSLRRA
jgi:hypothetical protein